MLRYIPKLLCLGDMLVYIQNLQMREKEQGCRSPFQTQQIHPFHIFFSIQTPKWVYDHKKDRTHLRSYIKSLCYPQHLLYKHVDIGFGMKRQLNHFDHLN
eukprot:NODE_11_length_54881_cov_1.430718.p48 type:complete len:100 gc:universal NODE_11_length_54881_cov_1.430718:32324-32025(-)